MQVLEGRPVVDALKPLLTERAVEFQKQRARAPGLGVILVGADPASAIYVKNKMKACVSVGFQSFERRLPASITQEELETAIKDFNLNPEVDGFLVQLPLPKHLDTDRALALIDPQKDPDGLTTENLGLLFRGTKRVASCTPAGIIALLDHYKIKIQGHHAVVVGRSAIVGKPMAQLLLERNATVTMCHSKTPHLRQFTSIADLVVVAAGQPLLLGREDFKEGAVIVDVGIHRTTKDNQVRLVGDVRFEEMRGWARAVTPVPGGVGPLTIQFLLENTMRLAELRSQA